MKTKTNSFTKFITFCVLALFLITNMIFFTSCDNGNSPNDNTNEEQNNTQNTDYCEICDGVQTENCGIKHKCDDENCVEYSDNKIYKDGHTHDYCERTDCDGSTHMNADHPTDTSWFKETPIGGEDSPYKVFVIDNNAYNEQDEFKSLTTDNVADKLNDFQDQYQKYIEDFKFSNAFKTKFSDAFDENGKLKINFADFFDNTDISTSGKIRYQRSFDPLIGHYDENDKSMNGSLNDICKPMIQEITKNIGTSGNNALDKQFFTLYYKAISNEIYRMGYNGEITTKTECIGNETEMEQKYIDTKEDCSKYDGYTVLPFENKYFYLENGKLNPEVVQQFDSMITRAAAEDRLNIDVKDLRNIINLSFTISAIQGTHDLTLTWPVIKDATPNNENERHGTANCATNEMVDAIENVKTTDMVANIVPTKLNKLNFSLDYGRELV